TCGLVTGAAFKRNLFVAEKSGPVARPARALSVPAQRFVPAQFIQQMLQAVGKGRLGPHGLLQAFADGITNGSQCLVINRLVAVIQSGNHGESPRRSVLGCDAGTNTCRFKSRPQNLFPRADPSCNRLRTTTRQLVPWTREKTP